MIRKKMLVKTKIIFIIICIVIISFLSSIILWNIHYNNLIKPLIKNEKLILTEDMNSKYYKYQENMISYLVAVPKFLKFNGNISVITGTNYDENLECTTDYSYSFMYKPYLFTDNIYRFTIHDYTNAKQLNDEPTRYIIYTDKNLNLLNETTTGKYNEFNKEIKSFYDDYVVNFFGKKVLK